MLLEDQDVVERGQGEGGREELGLPDSTKVPAAVGKSAGGWEE